MQPQPGQPGPWQQWLGLKAEPQYGLRKLAAMQPQQQQQEAAEWQLGTL
jgi:hypothetical protein